MQNVSEEFKTAIASPSPEFKSSITFPDLVLDDYQIKSINLDSLLVGGDDFEIGTAPMDMVKVELVEDTGDEWGRNLIPNTSDKNKTVSWSGWDYHLVNVHHIEDIGLSIGDPVVFRLYIEETNEPVRAFVQFRLNDGSGNRYRQKNGNIIYEGESGWSEVKFTISEEDVRDLQQFTVAIRNVNASNATVTYRKAKLEKGLVATPWTPAPEDYANYDYKNKECDIELGLTLPDESVEYVSIGKFTVESAVRKNNTITLDCVDRMYKAEKDYVSDLMYPTTLGEILQSACDQAGIELATTTFANSDYIVPNEPVFEGVTCRKVFAQVAELAGGYAKINRLGQLEIVTLGNESVRDITKDHYFDLKINEVAEASIDKVIVKVGEETATKGDGENIYTIVDNMFVQNPNDVVDALYNVLKNVSYTACTLKWQGDFSLDLGDKVTVDGNDTYVLSRKLTYTGGLREDYSAPAKSNIEKESTGKGSLTLDIENVKTQIKVINGEIKQTVEKIEGEVRNEVAEQLKNAEIYTWIKYADDEYGNGISDSPAGKKYVGIAVNKKNIEPSNNPSDYQWSRIQGERGLDGQTTYTWIKYADDKFGNGMSDEPDDKRYVGIATNKTTPNKSTNPADYEWSPLYDNVEIGGENRLFDSRTNIEFFHGDWGRNLILNSNYFPLNGSDFGNTNLTEIKIDENGEEYFSVVPINNGNIYWNFGMKFSEPRYKDQVYTFSFDVMTEQDENWGFYFYTDSKRNITNIPSTKGKWVRYTYTFTQEETKNDNILFGFRDLKAGKEIGWRRLKLEKGSVATPWTPALEDLDGGLDIQLIRGPGKPYYKVFNPHGSFVSLAAAFPNSRFAEPLESLGRVTVSLEVVTDVDRNVTINGATFPVKGNRWTKIHFSKTFDENTTKHWRVRNPFSRKRTRDINIGTKLIEQIYTDINTLYYRNLQVEKGNVPTDWNLTPEELEGSITRTSTEIKQLSDSISLIARRNENTGRFEVTPESIVAAINTTDGVGRVKTVGVTINENGLTVDDGAVIIRDSQNTAIITSHGLKIMFIYTSSGDLSGWQRVGPWSEAGYLWNREAYITFRIPDKMTVTNAELITRSIPTHWTDWTEVPDGIYHARNLRLFIANSGTDGVIDFPARSSYGVVMGDLGRTDITNAVWGGSWSPTGNGIVEKIGNVTQYIENNKFQTFGVATTDAPTQDNMRYIGGVQFILVVEGYLRG